MTASGGFVAAVTDAAKRLFWKRADYRAVFGTPEGKRVLADILATAEMGRSPLAPGDALTTGVNVGMQNLAKLIAQTIDLGDRDIIILGKESPYGHQTEAQGGDAA
ncbi:MAG: hypothetical protein U1A72_13325 [Sulfuritalea sp.]|nr:hypothetical protein [Sulfuritalea sp.]